MTAASVGCVLGAVLTLGPPRPANADIDSREVAGGLQPARGVHVRTRSRALVRREGAARSDVRPRYRRGPPLLPGHPGERRRSAGRSGSRSTPSTGSTVRVRPRHARGGRAEEPDPADHRPRRERRGPARDLLEPGQLESLPQRRILFGPDGMLYVVGDGHDATNAQDLTRNDRGKILRMTSDGEVPGTNHAPAACSRWDPQLVQVRVRPADRPALADRERAGVQRRGQPDPQGRNPAGVERDLHRGRAAEHEPRRPRPVRPSSCSSRRSASPASRSARVPPGVNERPAGVLRCRERRPDPARHARRATERHPSCPGGVRPSVGRAVGRGPAPVGRCSSATSAPSTGSSNLSGGRLAAERKLGPCVHRSTPGGLERSSPVGIPWCQEHRRESRRVDPHGHRDAETHHRGRADRPARAGDDPGAGAGARAGAGA